MKDFKIKTKLKMKNNKIFLIIIILIVVIVFLPYILKINDLRTSENLRIRNSTIYDLSDSVSISAGDYESYEITPKYSEQDISIYIETARSNQFIDFFFLDVANYNKWQQNIQNFTSIVNYLRFHSKRIDFTTREAINYFLILSNRDGTSKITLDFLVDFDSNSIPYFEEDVNRLVGNGIILEIGDDLLISNEYETGDKVIIEFECYFPFDELLMMFINKTTYEAWISLNKPFSIDNNFYSNIVSAEFLIETEGEFFLVFSPGRHLDTVTFSYSFTLIEYQPSPPPIPSPPPPPPPPSFPNFLIIFLVIVMLLILIITGIFYANFKKKYKYQYRKKEQLQFFHKDQKSIHFQRGYGICKEWVSETIKMLPDWIFEYRISTGETRGRIDDLDLASDIIYVTFDINREQKYVRAYKRFIDIPNIRKIFKKMPNYLRERFIKGIVNVLDEENNIEFLTRILKVDEQNIQDYLNS